MTSTPSQYRSPRRAAFTLVEVMLVIVILTVLAGIAVVGVQQTMARAGKGEATIFVKSMKTPLEQFFMDHKRYPTTAEGLDALLNPPPDVDESKGVWPYIDPSAVKADPWGMPYQYAYPGQRNPNSYDLWSLGPDRAPDTGDEIGNW
ncbi:MAG: type II secretion system major pseudopilin GspG [Planctomycetaceae bacterium]|nr:type II secretion system major pseudopilin GspG [Planctomycetaceae bacterium]